MAQTTDVDGMLDSMTPEQFAEWQAYYQIEPFGDDWSQSASIACEVRRFMEILIAGLAGNQIKNEQLSQPTDFVPGIKGDKHKQQDVIDPEIFESACKAVF